MRRKPRKQGRPVANRKEKLKKIVENLKNLISGKVSHCNADTQTADNTAKFKSRVASHAVMFGSNGLTFHLCD